MTEKQPGLMTGESPLGVIKHGGAVGNPGTKWRRCFDGKIVYAMIINMGCSVAMLPIIHKVQEAKYPV